MGVVTQLLLPGVEINDTTEKKEKKAQFSKVEMVQMSKHRGLRAELYKLNIYSGPSGKFKAHVDTPRSEHQIGSLVVSLPTTFEGKSVNRILLPLSIVLKFQRWTAGCRQQRKLCRLRLVIDSTSRANDQLGRLLQ